MRVIDIILNEATDTPAAVTRVKKPSVNQPTVNTPKAVEKADALIARIKSFLNPADPNRVQILDLQPKNPNNALTADRLDADTSGAIKTQLETWIATFEASKTANDGNITYWNGEFKKWLKKQELKSVVSNIAASNSINDPINVYYAYAEPAIQLLKSTDDTKLFTLLPNSGFPIAISFITKAPKTHLQNYIDQGATLVNDINISNDPQTVDDLTSQLANLNLQYTEYLRKGLYPDTRKRLNTLGIAIPEYNVRSETLDYVKQASNDIMNFINSTNPDDRLNADFDYFRSDLANTEDDTDEATLTRLATQMANVTTSSDAKPLKRQFLTFLQNRQNIASQTSTWALNKYGLGKNQQLGELPNDFDQNNPLHNAWKVLIEEANRINDRPDVSGFYKDFWPTVNIKYQWKCYLTNLDMVATDNSPYKISIDRINSNKIYEPTNVAFCCARVNVLKGNLLNNELIAMCKQILTHNGLLATSLNETAITDPCREFVNKKGSKISITDKLIKLEKLAQCIFKNYNDYMYTYEIRQLFQIVSVLDKENKNPTSEAYAKFLYKSPEMRQKIIHIKNKVVNRTSKYRTPAQCLLTGLTDVKRYVQMTFDDFKHDAQRIVKLQPKLRTRVDAAIRDAELFYQDADQMGQSTIKDKYAEKLSATLTDKYRSQRKREREYNMLGRYELPISARRREKEKVEKYKPTISTDELVTIAKAQRGKCAITGLPMSAITNSPDMVSIDRTDSKLGGYSAKNIQLVLRRVNTMKGDLPMKDFLYWCSQIYNNREVDVTDEDLKAAVLHALANDKDAIINDKTD
jgi:hypothetical protein